MRPGLQIFHCTTKMTVEEYILLAGFVIAPAYHIKYYYLFQTTLNFFPCACLPSGFSTVKIYPHICIHLLSCYYSTYMSVFKKSKSPRTCVSTRGKVLLLFLYSCVAPFQRQLRYSHSLTCWMLTENNALLDHVGSYVRL